jgi:hypothetical protein
LPAHRWWPVNGFEEIPVKAPRSLIHKRARRSH